MESVQKLYYNEMQKRIFRVSTIFILLFLCTNKGNFHLWLYYFYYGNLLLHLCRRGVRGILQYTCLSNNSKGECPILYSETSKGCLSRIYTRRFCQPTQNLKISKQNPSKNRAKIRKQFTDVS